MTAMDWQAKSRVIRQRYCDGRDKARSAASAQRNLDLLLEYNIGRMRPLLGTKPAQPNPLSTRVFESPVLASRLNTLGFSSRVVGRCSASGWLVVRTRLASGALWQIVAESRPVVRVIGSVFFKPLSVGASPTLRKPIELHRFVPRAPRTDRESVIAACPVCTNHLLLELTTPDGHRFPFSESCGLQLPVGR